MRFFIIILMIIFLGGCVQHISPYSPKKRLYKYSGPKETQSSSQKGSLWSDNSQMGSLFTDTPALKEGDLITIVISESSAATGEANTDAKRSSETNISVDALFNFMGYLKKTYPDVDTSKLIGQRYSNEFSGSGKTSRKGTLYATVTATIEKRLPTGNYFIEGQKVILVNDEEHHFYISGVIRPQDVEEGNQIYSDRIAEAQIEFTGRGAISEKSSPGWFSSFIDFIWPF